MSKYLAFYERFNENVIQRHDFYSYACDCKLSEYKRFLKPIIRPRSVLDVGCSDGTITQGFRRIYPSAIVVGLDISETAISIARDKYGEGFYQIQEGENSLLEVVKSLAIKYNIKFFDLIVLSDLLEHLPNPKKHLDILKNYGKYFFIKLPIEASWYDNIFLPYIVAKHIPSIDNPNEDGHVREFSYKDVREFIEALNCTILADRYWVHPLKLSYPPMTSRPRLLSNPKAFLRLIIKRYCSIIIKALFKNFLTPSTYITLFGCSSYMCLCEPTGRNSEVTERAKSVETLISPGKV